MDTFRLAPGPVSGALSEPKTSPKPGQNRFHSEFPFSLSSWSSKAPPGDLLEPLLLDLGASKTREVLFLPRENKLFANPVFGALSLLLSRLGPSWILYRADLAPKRSSKLIKKLAKTLSKTCPKLNPETAPKQTSKWDPRHPKTAPRRPKDGPKTAPRGSKKVVRGSQTRRPAHCPALR